jgi:hypothetical protein
VTTKVVVSARLASFFWVQTGLKKETGIRIRDLKLKKCGNRKGTKEKNIIKSHNDKCNM